MMKSGDLFQLVKRTLREISRRGMTTPMSRPDISHESRRNGTDAEFHPVPIAAEAVAEPATSEAERIQEIYKRLKPAFAAHEPVVPEAIVAEEFGLAIRIDFDPAMLSNPTCFGLSIRGTDVGFRFSKMIGDDALSNMIVERWWGILALVVRLAASSGDQPIDTLFNLNDEGVEEGLAFCDNRPQYSLIPDCVFIGTRGYQDQRNRFTIQNILWEDKRDVVFWRGTSTGRPFGDRHELPRITLCRLCRSDTTGIFDVGLTGLVDHGADETGHAESRSLLAGFVPWHDFDRYRYHIDIDGHTNSWPGLMFKLLSGGLVFKVDPPSGHRQWYYERLRPWENYVPVKSDLSDLLDLVAYFRRNEVLARSISNRGRKLALSMDFSGELDIGIRTILGRCAREQYLRDRG